MFDSSTPTLIAGVKSPSLVKAIDGAIEISGSLLSVGPLWLLGFVVGSPSAVLALLWLLEFVVDSPSTVLELPWVLALIFVSILLVMGVSGLVVSVRLSIGDEEKGLNENAYEEKKNSNKKELVLMNMFISLLVFVKVIPP